MILESTLSTGLADSFCISTSSSSCLGILILLTCRGRHRPVTRLCEVRTGGCGGADREACTHREHPLGLAASAHVGVVDVLEHHPGLVVFARLEGGGRQKKKNCHPPKKTVNISSQICKINQRKYERFFSFFLISSLAFVFLHASDTPAA